MPVGIVPNARESHARLCQTLAGNPSRQLKLIGVMGRSGKTTISCLIAGVLRAADHRVGIVGTLGYLDGRIVEKATRATPPPDRLAPLLARMVRNDCSHAVMEVTRQAIEQSRTAGVEFDAVCATNVATDHGGHVETLLRQLGPDGFAVLNADDPGSAGCLRRLACPTLTVGIRSPAEIAATPLEQCLSEQTFLLTAGSETVPVRTPMIGRQHIYHCLVAAAVGLAYDIPLTTVVRGLEYAGHVPGRLERIECGQPFGVFLDYAHTPGGLARVLKTLRGVTAGRLICVFSAGSRREQENDCSLAGTVEQRADLAIPAVSNRRAAICQALDAAEPGDCVLIAGSGPETPPIKGRRRVPLDEKQLVRERLCCGAADDRL